MAFEAAPGNGNLPNGNWSPVIYSQKLLNYFRTINIVDEITNTDYEGEIKAYGDTVNIMKEPLITVSDYKRGTKIQRQDLSDEQLQLVVDQGKYFAFAVDDIEKRMSHIDWEAGATKSGADELKKAYDLNVLAHMQAEATTNVAVGTSGAPITIGYGLGASFTPLDYIGRFARLLDENDVPEDGRYFVATPAFWEQVGVEDSKLVDIAVTGDPASVIRMRKFATSKMIHGFTCFKSNNLPEVGGNVTVLAGHRSAAATATTILETEKQRLIDTFGDQVKGLLVFGRKVLRPEALLTGHISSFLTA